MTPSLKCDPLEYAKEDTWGALRGATEIVCATSLQDEFNHPLLFLFGLTEELSVCYWVNG